MHHFDFKPVQLPPSAEPLRRRVRSFLAEAVSSGDFKPTTNSWGVANAVFSRKCGEAGYIGMTWPKRYGGQEKSALERYVVTEEMLAAGAPVGAHWVADRQSGSQILAHASERAKETILPRICAGECFFAIGMSEPDSGSDLAAARTKATRAPGGWHIDGTKVWTSRAHEAHYLIVLARSSKEEDKHAGLTQFIVDMSQSGIQVRPIYNLQGSHDFNEVVFDGCFVPDDMVVGAVGSGWSMVTGELALERSGPDRFLSSYRLLVEGIRELGPNPDAYSLNEIGRFVAHLATLRRMSTSIAGMIDRGSRPAVEAALVKDIGTTFEREIPEVFRHLIAAEPSLGDGDGYAELLGTTIMRAPSFTIRGGTREILRSMIAKGLGLR